MMEKSRVRSLPDLSLAFKHAMNCWLSILPKLPEYSLLNGPEGNLVVLQHWSAFLTVTGYLLGNTLTLHYSRGKPNETIKFTVNCYEEMFNIASQVIMGNLDNIDKNEMIFDRKSNYFISYGDCVLVVPTYIPFNKEFFGQWIEKQTKDAVGFEKKRVYFYDPPVKNDTSYSEKMKEMYDFRPLPMHSVPFFKDASFLNDEGDFRTPLPVIDRRAEDATIDWV